MKATENQGKVHLADMTANTETYKGSPHIVKAIEEHRFSVCKTIPTKITQNVNEVTCHACLAKLGPIPLERIVEQAYHNTHKFINNKTLSALNGFKRFCNRKEK